MAIHAPITGAPRRAPINLTLPTSEAMPDPDTCLAVFMSLIRQYGDAEIAQAVDALIAELDGRAGDPDREQDDEPEEDDEDCCRAGDDRIFSGAADNAGWFIEYAQTRRIGDDEDDEHSCPAMHGVNQTLPLILTAANDPCTWRATA